MKSKEVEFHGAAAAELEAALDWYLERSESAAERFAVELRRAVALVAESPGRWPAGGNNTRKFPLRKFPFAIIYRELLHVVQILAVAHSHRRPDYWKRRL
jgi:plasmid stabilization system protein ParE